MTFLRFGRDEAAALPAAEKAAIDIRFQVRGFWLALLAHHVLAAIEQPFGNKGLMLTFVSLAAVLDEPVVKSLRQDAVILRAGQRLVVAIGHAQFIHDRGETIKRVGSARIEFKQTTDQGPTLRIGHNPSRPVVVEIADRSDHRPDAIADLVSLAADDVLREIIYVILGLPEHHGQHELSMSSSIDWHRGKAKVCDRRGIKEIDELAGIERIPGKTIRMPRENSFGFASLDAGEHFIENGATGPLGRLLLDKCLDDFKPFFACKFTKFGELIVDASDLALRIVRGLAGVDEISRDFCVHGG